jgi:hypothetical protein
MPGASENKYSGMYTECDLVRDRPATNRLVLVFGESDTSTAILDHNALVKGFKADQEARNCSRFCVRAK